MKERRAKPPPGRNRPISAFAPALALAIVVLGSLIVALLHWYGAEVDRMARERDKATAQTVLSQSVEHISHSLEAVLSAPGLLDRIKALPANEAWLDGYVQRWLSGYVGLDEVYVLSQEGAPIYAMRAGKRAYPETYIAVEEFTTPLVREAQRVRFGANRQADGSYVQTPVVADIEVVRGRPAILSVKPVLTGAERPGDPVGRERPLVVGVSFLDGAYFARLARQYDLTGVHYQLVPSNEETRASRPLRSKFGAIIGYLIWRPFAPGMQVVSALAPVLMVLVLVAAVVVYVLASRLARRTRDLETSRSLAQHQALHDGLTGLANRSLFESRFDEALARCEAQHEALALICIDLDRFKQINDTLGHPAGDELIRQVASRLLAEVREYDIVARLGGDEFAVVIVDPQDRQAVEGICGRIVHALGRPFDLFGAKAFIGASVGVACAPDDGCGREELLRRVDIALYAAKAGGRSRYLFFTPEMDVNVREREILTRELRKALAEGGEQFVVRYQPIFCARSGRVTAAEALVRWNHPERGLIGPGEFIQQAEDSGLIHALGLLVLRQALADARAWPSLRISVNVSPLQMQEPEFVHMVNALLEESRLSPERLELEVTETALMSSSCDVARAVGELRALGVACALDDFGTGYSSLSHIRDMAVDRIKIDKSFVQAIDTPKGAGLVEAIVNLARINGVQLTAEGVETPAQLRFLRDIACEELQGYLLARPVTAEELAALLVQGEAVVREAFREAGCGEWSV